MNKHRAHDIVHQFSGGKAENCSFCQGKMDEKEMLSEAVKIAGENYKPQVNPALPFNQRLVQYDENGQERHADVVTLIDVMKFAENADDIPTLIKLLPIGNYDMNQYGKTSITKEMVTEMKKHFDEGIRAGGKAAGLPIDIEHGTTSHKDAAAGWIKDMIIKSDGMYGKVDWTELGKQLLKDRIYKFYSPEFWFNYTDPENQKKMTNVMTGGGLVNKPMIKHDLKPIVNSEGQKQNLTKEISSLTIFLEPNKTAQNETMKLSEIIAKKKEERTSEEAKFLNDHKEELTLAEAKAEGFAIDKPADKKEEAPAAGGVKLAEGQIVVEKKQFDSLVSLAERGAAADDKLKKAELREEVKKAVFSEKGSKLPTDQIEKWTEKLFKMSEEDKKETLEMLGALPEKTVLGEVGSDQNKGGKGSAAAEDLDKQIRKYMEDKKVDYATAASAVTAANPVQLQEYNDDLPVAGVER